MAYSNFTFNQLREEYDLEIKEQSALFAGITPVAISESLQDILRKRTALALRSGSEKARSEYLIAPILAEVYDQAIEKASLFSGVEFKVDELRGLSGYCDFILTLAPHTVDIQAPVVSIVEAKKEDIIAGIPQCLAELVAAQIFNERTGLSLETLYGVVTAGDRWRFLHLRGTKATIDTDDYYLTQVEKIVGIILSMLENPK